MNWYVGQPVVCVEQDVWRFLIVGKTYIVTLIAQCPHCKTVALGVGFTSDAAEGDCNVCGDVAKALGEWTFRESRFRPLDPLAEQIARIESEGAPVEQFETIEA